MQDARYHDSSLTRVRQTRLPARPLTVRPRPGTDPVAAARALQQSVGNAALARYAAKTRVRSSDLRRTPAAVARSDRDLSDMRSYVARSSVAGLQRVVVQQNDTMAGRGQPLPSNVAGAMTAFTSVLRADPELGWIVSSPVCTMNLRYVDKISGAMGMTNLWIKASGKEKTDWMSLGEGDLGRLRRLLQTGTPKQVKIDIVLSKEVVDAMSQDEHMIAATLAHEVGTHVAPYAPLLKRAVGLSGAIKLTSGQVRTLERAHGDEREETDHRALHTGYLTWDWSPWRVKPRYRELVDALAQTHYTGQHAVELWKEYTDDVGRYHTGTGEALRGPVPRDAQQQFYADYEAYRRAGSKGTNPRLTRALRSAAVPLAVLMLLLIVGLMFSRLTNLGSTSEKPDHADL